MCTTHKLPVMMLRSNSARVPEEVEKVYTRFTRCAKPAVATKGRKKVRDGQKFSTVVVSTTPQNTHRHQRRFVGRKSSALQPTHATRFRAWLRAHRAVRMTRDKHDVSISDLPHCRRASVDEH